jgi:hypothetical protein
MIEALVDLGTLATNRSALHAGTTPAATTTALPPATVAAERFTATRFTTRMFATAARGTSAVPRAVRAGMAAAGAGSPAFVAT